MTTSPSTSPSPVDLILDALATYRLTKLVNDDYVTQPLRDRVVARYGEPDQSKVSYMVHCPWCVSIYTGAVVSASRMMFPNSRIARAAAAALAFSAVTGLIKEREGSF